MRKPIWFVRAAAIAIFCLAAGFPAESVCRAIAAGLEAPRRGVAEFSLRYDQPLDNPFVDVEARGEFSGPGRETGPVRVEGFYDGGGVWKFRFAPGVHGNWTAFLRLIHAGRTVASLDTAFVCRGEHGHGFLRRSRDNPYRLEYEDGTPFYSVGIQPCGAAAEGLDGPPRGEGTWRAVPMDTFIQAFQGAANLFRIQLGAGTRQGCAREIMVDSLGLWRYNLEECRLLDQTYELLGRYRFSSILIPFQDMSLWQEDNTSFGSNRDVRGWKDIDQTEANEPVRRYLRYVIARWGAYTDIWELFNEDVYTPDAWLEAMAAFVRSHDPYGHLLTTNYERPRAAWNDIVTAHMYMSVPAWETEMRLTNEFARLKSFGKPVMFTEFGNKGTLSNRDPLKWRVAAWTAFMNEGSMLFWSMSGIQTVPGPGQGGNSNAYLGPESRKYFRNFLDFVRDLPVTLRPVFVGYAGRDGLDKYALSNGDVSVLYIHHYTGYDSAASGEAFVWTGPGRFEIQWYDTGEGRVIKTEEASTESNTLLFKSPGVTTDIAAKIHRVGW